MIVVLVRVAGLHTFTLVIQHLVLVIPTEIGVRIVAFPAPHALPAYVLM